MSFYGLGTEFKMLEDALEAGGVAWWLMELPSGAVFFSSNKIKMLGYNQKQASEFLHYTNFTDLLHPDDHDNAMKAMQDHLNGKAELYETCYRIKKANGKYRTLYDRGCIVAKKGKEVAVAGIVLDVTKHFPKLPKKASKF